MKKFSNRMPLWLQILIGLIIGAIIGLVWKSFGAALLPIGTAFIKLIKMIVIPLVFSAVTLGIYKMGSNFKQLGRLGGIAIGWFFLATGFAALLGIVLSLVLHPGAGIDLQATGKIPDKLSTSISWSQFFLDLIPDNILNAMSNQKILPTLVFAIFFGVSLARAGDIGKPVVRFLEGILETMFHLTHIIISLAPIAVAAIMSYIFSTQGWGLILGMGKLILTMYLGLLIMLVAFWIVMYFLKEKPLVVTKKILEPLLLAFTTRSSEVTLPVHLEILEKMGIPNKVVSFVLPLGYTFNLDGSALYQALAVTFLADAYGLHLDFASILTILLTTLIANKGTANVPSASLVVLAVILTSVGLPVEAIAILAGVDVFMDMGRTAVNVLGNTVAVHLAHRFGGAQLADEGAGEDRVE